MMLRGLAALLAGALAACGVHSPPASPPPAPDTRGGDPLAALFHAPRALSMTPVLQPGPARILDDGLEAFQARVVALTGSRLPDAVIDAGAVDAPIDFSNAPALDSIQISALHMRADFSGAMLGRMLAWHAARGTRVRIMLTDRLMLRQDRRFYQELANQNPGIELRLHQLPPGGGPLWHLDRLHRSNHVKIFATQARQPGRSVFMIGGRNFHDGFAFDRPRDLSAWPSLRQYESVSRHSFAFFSVYRDLELAWNDDAAVRKMMAHAESFLDGDFLDPRLPPAPGTSAKSARAPGVRHFISVPHADDRALEALYVELFDAASHRLDLASPFANLPPRLDAAMARALARGVRIRLISRTDVPEPAAIAVSGYNRLFAESHGGQLDFFAHRRHGVTLHSKVVIVDGRLSVVTSTNLNQRSFWHDTENGVLILGTAEARRLTAVLDGYERESIRLEGPQPVNPLLRALLPAPAIRRFF